MSRDWSTAASTGHAGRFTWNDNITRLDGVLRASVGQRDPTRHDRATQIPQIPPPWTAAVAAGDDAAAVQGQAAVPDLRRRARPGAHAAGAGHPETPWRQRVVLPGRQTDRAASRSGAAARVRRAPNRPPLPAPSASTPPAAGPAERRSRPPRPRPAPPPR